MLQSVFDILVLLLTIITICSVLIALQFPIVMSSPITALGFAILITVCLGSVSAKVGTTLAPLPIFALILVCITHKLNICFCIDQIQSTAEHISRERVCATKCRQSVKIYFVLFFFLVFYHSLSLFRFYLHTNQGVHTMLPISWPVSVVLAAILSIIHFGFRIVLYSDNFPELFIQTVSVAVGCKSFKCNFEFMYKIAYRIACIIYFCT